MTSPIISVQNLGKAYRIGVKEEVPDTLIGAVKSIATSPLKNLRALRKLDASVHTTQVNNENASTIWALKDVSFEVNEGEVLGIIGRNGAGKSTLLKVLSRITEPTNGRAIMRGRVSSLLEVGTGFHPELSGRDNIYMNGTILGMTKREIDRKFDEIVDFSGVERFLDTPTKRYSSGMQVRLAFAVAAHLEPEILVVDEVLAVGDLEFQKKCINKMQNISSTGRTVLFVSHNMAAIESLCSRVIGLADHTVSIDGSVADGLQWYLNLPSASLTPKDRTDRKGVGTSRINAIEVTPCDRDKSVINMGDAIRIEIQLDCVQNQKIHVGIALLDSYGTRLMRLNTKDMAVPPLTVADGSVVTCETKPLSLLPGTYSLSVGISDCNGQILDQLLNAKDFDIHPSPIFPSGVIPSESGAKVFSLSTWLETPQLSEPSIKSNT